jgi:hypothetical protein
MACAFTHLWNPIGFPSVYIDEAHYMRRAMQVLDGVGPQESRSVYTHPYDHPYFGQLFLAGVLSMIGYPDSLNISSLTTTNATFSEVQHVIQVLYLVPRVLMGILAVVDTFLIYKICENRYNKKVAFIASILFAVMPMTWMFRRIYLDTLLTPFLLSSILFASYYKTKGVSRNKNGSYNNKVIVLLSAVFLGLAIFTKIPAIAIIPLVGLLIYTNNNRKLKILGLWFIPVILIPLIWPAYSIYLGQVNLWLKGVVYQLERSHGCEPICVNQSVSRANILNSIYPLLRLDPILLIMGAVGSIFSAIKRDFFTLLWFIPFMVFFAVVQYADYFYIIPVIPALCIGAAKLIDYLTDKTSINKRMAQQWKWRWRMRWQIPALLRFIIIISGIAIFGLISTTLLITTNVNSTYFDMYASIIQNLQINNNNNNHDKVTMIGQSYSRTFFWIPRYVLHKDIDFVDPHFNDQIRTQKVLFIADQPLVSYISSKKTVYLKQIQHMYINSTTMGTFFDFIPYNLNQYPYTSMTENLRDLTLGKYVVLVTKIRTNYQ